MTQPLRAPSSAPTSQAAWEAVAMEEANALMMLLERKDLKVMVVIVGAHTDPEGTTDLIHSVSAKTRMSHANQFRTALCKRVQFLTGIITGAEK